MQDLKIAVVTGGHGFEVIPFHGLFRALAGVDAYIQCVEDFAGSPEAVRDGYGVVVFYIMPGGAPQGKAAQAFARLGETGQGIVMLHHALFAYPEWPVWDEMTGITGRVVTAYSHDERIPVEIAAPGHPVVRGIVPWTITDETYVLHDPGPDSQVLLTTTHPACMRSLAWTRAFRASRVFCYQSGHDHQAFEDAYFHAVLRSGIFWTARREP